MGIRIAVWLALAAAWPVATAAAFSQDAWQFYKPVTVTEAGVNRLALDDEIFGQARADMADLRIIAAGAEVPYVVAAEAGTAVPVNVSARLTNATFVRGAYSQAVADFGAPIPEVDHVVLGVTGDNFQRRVTVEGSNDAAAWQTVTENGYIYDYTDSRGGVAITDTTVRFTPATFRYYRIRIAADAGEPLPIHSIRSAQLASQPPRARTQERPAIITSEGNRTRLTVDMEQTGIPVTAVAVAATDTNFDRGVIVEASDDQAAWRHLASGHVYRYTTDRYRAEQLAIDLPVSHARYYRVTVLNRDDQPLTLASRATVTTEYRELLFEAQAGESYRLYYGNAGAERPYYDFQRYSAYLDTDAAARATLGAAIANPDWQPQGPVTERLPWLLPSAVVAIALLLAGVVWRFLRTA